MTDNKIIIDGAIFNKCDGCPLYDGDICTGARLDEETSKEDTNICNEHLAEQFWVVQRQLKLKQQECEELQKKIKKYSKINEQDTKDFAKLKQECKNLEEEQRRCRIGIKDISIENTEICKISEKYKRVLDEIENLSTNAFCLINGTNKDMSNFAKQILNIINKTKEQQE